MTAIPLDFTDEVVLVTGGATGIGQATSEVEAIVARFAES
jgi:NAD(P)-dependent dehydrogenase (short-subunit alcohol dehydrogenase family)